MKRILAILVSVTMLISMGAIMASAGDFVEPVGDVSVAWLSEDQVAEIEFDGQIDEWVDFGLEYARIGRENLVVWHKDNVPMFNPDEAISEDFSINAYFAADPNYLYVAFFIEGDNFALSDNPSAYNGDAFQIGVDWNSHMEAALADGVDYSNNKNVFYSFACLEEGAPLQIMVQEGFKDRVLTEAGSEDPANPDMKGSAGSYGEGWCAEFCLSWELLYGDFEYKTWEVTEDPFNADNPIRLGLTIAYINREETNGEITWAAGTFKDDTTFYDHRPDGNGLYAVLEWEEGRELVCAGIGEGTTPPPVDPGTVETDPVVEPGSETEAVEDVETTAAASNDAASDDAAETTKAAETTAADDDAEEATTKAAEKKSGCGSFVGATGAVALVSVLAAGVVLGKKKD